MIILTILTTLLVSCCREPVSPPPPTAAPQLEVIWKTLLVPEENTTFRTIAMTPVLYNDAIIFNTDYTINGIEAPVLFLDTADGSIKQTWNDLQGDSYNHETVVKSGNYLAFGDLTTVDCLNLQNATTAWKSSVALQYPFLHAANDYLCRGFPSDPTGNLYNTATIRRTPVDILNWQNVYSFTTTDDYKPSFTGYGSGTLANGDEVVVWKNWSTKINTTEERADVFAYNLTADSLMWRVSGFMEGAMTVPLQVQDGVVYGTLEHSAIAIDLATGNMLWQLDLKAVNSLILFAVLPFHLDGNFMLVQSRSVNTLFYINKNTGSIARQVDVPSRYDRFAYFEGNLYGAGSKISIINIASGENLLADYDQSMFESWNSGITIDPDRRVFYCHDGEYAYCIKIPDL
jgi:hypothetical protein